MTTPVPIVTSNRIVYRHPKTICYIADALREAEFEEVPWLRCERLRVVCGPEVDQAELSFVYGDVIRERTEELEYFEPEELEGKFVKIKIVDTVYEDAFAEDPDTDEEDLTITWYGIIEHDARQTAGTTPENVAVPADGLHARGEQFCVAFGLVRLLEKEFVDSSVIDIDGTEANELIVKHGLAFNSDPGGAYLRRGNRSTSKVGDSYIYAWEPRGQFAWSAYDAVEYLLTRQTPRTASDLPANTWRLEADPQFLNWYDIDLQTDGWPVKGLIDQLIPRQRGVGYLVEFDTALIDAEDPDSGSKDEIVLRVFTFNDSDIALPTGATLKANPDLRSLDYEHALDVIDATVSDTGMSRYDRIIARGDKRTTTFTYRIEGEEIDKFSAIIPGWDADDETEYKAGASGAGDYSSLTPEGKRSRNAIARSSERLSEVYRRYCLNQQLGTKRWECSIPTWHQEAIATKYYLSADLTQDPFSAVFDTVSDPTRYEHVPSLRLRRDLPLYEGFDYSGTALTSFSYSAAFSADKHPSFIRTFVYAMTHDGGDGETDPTSRFEIVDKLNRSWAAAGDRTWSVQIGVLDTEPGVEIRAQVPHFLAGTDTTGFADMADHENHSLQKGIKYSDLWVTMCVELNEHVEATVELNEPDEPQPVKTLIINIRGARHDYVIPYTVVDIQDGRPVQTTSGGTAKNDLPRLKDIARAAAEWYSKKRRTLNLSYRQVRGLIKLGWLITDVGGAYNWTGINTVVTAITYDLGRDSQPGSTTLETSYTNLDFDK